MFKPPSIIAGLEIGTSKVCAVVGEVNPSGSFNVIGLGQAKSRGVRKGEIVDVDFAVEDVRNALAEAEQMADVEISSVYLGVTGAHIRGFNNRGYHPVATHDREIMQEDLQDAVKNAKAINLPAENRLIHVLRQHYLVDGQEGVLNPVGMVGAKVEVDIRVVHGNYNRLQNSIRAIRSLQLEVEDIVFTGIASALALLNNHQKELGSLVIDLGGGSTEYVLYSRGVIKHTGVIAVGGDHVSNDLAYGLKVPLRRAEQLKLEHGSALIDDRLRGQTLGLANDHGLVERSINLHHLRRIMSLRLQEIFEIIAHDLDQAGLLDRIREGIFLCGGGSRINEIQRLASQVFRLPVSIGQANGVSGLKSAIDQPEFSTAIGLVRFGLFEHKKRSSSDKSVTSGITSAITQIFRRA